MNPNPPETARHIVCPHCTAVNRIAAGRNAAQAKCGKCGRLVFVGKATPVDGPAFDKHIQRNDIPVVVDFWAQWCGPCIGMAPAYERAAAQMEPGFRFLKVDTEANSDLAARHRIQAIPTLMLFRNGKMVAQRAGASSGEALRAWIEANA